jgi:hypothetical protein
MMELLSLSLPSLEWLFEDRGLTISEASPLGFMTAVPRQSKIADRAQTASAEGLASGGQLAEGYGEAIEILARPEAQIALVLVDPSRALGGASYYARAGRAVQFHLRPQGCQLGRPVSVDSLAIKLGELLAGPGPLEGAAEAILWPRVLSILTALWPMAERQVSAAVPRDEAVARLASSPVAAKGPDVVAELVRNKMLRAANRELTIHPRWQPWLEAAWSGHLCELHYLPLPAAGPPDVARKKRVLFAGPPGRRLRSRHVSGEELAKRAGSFEQAPVEGKAILLTSLSQEATQAEVRALLDLPRPA